MPLSSAVRERCRVLFQPDEELRYLFPATSVSLGRGILGMAHFIIAISDTRMTVLSSSWWRRHTPTSVYARYPRAIQLGPMDTSMAPTYAIGSLVLETDEEYDSLIRAADAEISGTDPLPPDPLPELYVSSLGPPIVTQAARYPVTARRTAWRPPPPGRS